VQQALIDERRRDRRWRRARPVPGTRRWPAAGSVPGSGLGPASSGPASSGRPKVRQAPVSSLAVRSDQSPVMPRRPRSGSRSRAWDPRRPGAADLSRPGGSWREAGGVAPAARPRGVPVAARPRPWPTRAQPVRARAVARGQFRLGVSAPPLTGRQPADPSGRKSPPGAPGAPEHRKTASTAGTEHHRPQARTACSGHGDEPGTGRSRRTWPDAPALPARPSTGAVPSARPSAQARSAPVRGD
jgi:hypothetical protein